MATHLSAVHNSEPAPAGMSAAEWQLRIDLAAAYRLAAIYGWTDLNNTHFSARVPGPDHHFLLNPFGMLFDEITASSLIKVDQDGTVLGNSDYPANPAGFVIHGAIHMAVPRARNASSIRTAASAPQWRCRNRACCQRARRRSP